MINNMTHITYEHKDIAELLTDKASPIYENFPMLPVPPGVEMELAGLKERLKKTQELELEVRRENAELKELLKECRDEIEYLRKHYKGRIDHFKNNTRLDKEINQALGEE